MLTETLPVGEISEIFRCAWCFDSARRRELHLWHKNCVSRGYG